MTSNDLQCEMMDFHDKMKNLTCFRPYMSAIFRSCKEEHLVCKPSRHRRTGRHFTGGAEKICPETNNLP